jgi:hypothetical protein
VLAVFTQITAELEISAEPPGDEYFLQEGRQIFEHVKKNTKGFTAASCRAAIL